MSILNKFTIKNLKLNKKRTIVTIIGIMLSTALICGVVGLVASFQRTLVNMVKKEEGFYHTTFNNVSKENLKYVEENNKVDSYFLTSQIGWAYLEGSKNEDKPYISILEYDKKALNNYGVQLVEGRLPENSNEILIPEHIKTNGRVLLEIGDTITLNLGKRKSSEEKILNDLDPYMNNIVLEDGRTITEEITDSYSKEYKIVGIMERLSCNKEGWNSPAYYAITYMEEVPKKANISVIYINSKEYIENNKNIQEVIDNDSINLNEELLRYEGAISENVLKVIYGIATIVMIIIMVSSIFVIRNSFSISVSEKNKQYGMMSSIGATSKQIRKTVLLEGLVIGLIAIPLGIILGVIAIIILLEIVNYLMADMLNELSFSYSIPVIAILISVVLSFITIYLSCLIPARRASKTSPIEAIRGNKDIKIKSKKIKTNKLIKKIFGIGGVIASKNLKRSRKKYRTTVISIVISIVIFISLSTFIQCGNKTSELYYTELNFNIIVERKKGRYI